MNNKQEKIDKLDYSLKTNFNNRLYRFIRIKEAIKGLKTDQLNVLEIGCGEGLCTQWLSERFKHVVALEPASKFYTCALAKIKANNVEIFHSFFEDFIYPDRQFDLVICANVLEHVEDAFQFLLNIYLRIKPKGRLLLTVPNAESLHRRIGLKMGVIKNITEMGPQDLQVGHKRYYTKQILQTQLKIAGFTIIEIDGILLKPFPYVEMEKLSKEYCNALYEVGKDVPEMCAEIFVNVEVT